VAGDLEHWLAVGMDDYMSNPLDPQIIAVLRSLADEGGPDLFGELVDLFIGELAPRIEGIRSGIQAADTGAVSQWAHSLKGSAGNFGAGRLATLCGQMEHEARRGSTAESAALMPALEAEARRVRRALEEACHGRS
jgi:HPt (histidine-containing phosphotransfer) domain-containing protein